MDMMICDMIFSMFVSTPQKQCAKNQQFFAARLRFNVWRTGRRGMPPGSRTTNPW